MYDHQLTKKTKDITNSPESKQQNKNKSTSLEMVQKRVDRKEKLSQDSFAPSVILQLQHTIGNKATARLLLESGAAQIQAKLKIGKPGDRYEQEADQVASRVVKHINAPETHSVQRETTSGIMQMQPEAGGIQRQEGEEEELQMMPASGVVQRQEGEEEELQMMPAGGMVQRQEGEEEEDLQMMPVSQHAEIPDEEENLQMKRDSLFQRKETEIPIKKIPKSLDSAMSPLTVRTRINATNLFQPPMQKKNDPLPERRENNTGMPDILKSGLETLASLDLSDVRVHRNSDKPPQVGALGYTQGTDIYIAPGQEQCLPHEGWHAVQQKQGRVQATTQAAGLPVNDEPALENEADVMGEKALLVNSGNEKTNSQNRSTDNKKILQYKLNFQSITGNHQIGCNCPTCAGYQPFNKNNNSPTQLKVAQMKKLKEADMQTFAETLAGDNSRTTVAVAKDGTSYNIYSLSSLSSQSDTINDYTNVVLKSDQSPGTGYHAETMALMDGGAGTKIAASQPICNRCQAALADNGVTADNPGAQYTEHWQAPFTEEIDEDKTFPGKAEDPSRDGLSGSRWGMTGGNLYRIKKAVWETTHPGGW